MSKVLELLLSKQRELRSQVAKQKSREWRENKRSVPHTLDYLRSVLEYEPDTGLFRWRVTRVAYGGHVNPGDKAGTIGADSEGRHDGGYVFIIVDQRRYRAHRLAWWFMTGTPPPKGIDVEHENGDRADNKWKNLRLATRSQNNCNTKLRVDNRSGFKGVHPSTGHAQKPWFARITIDKRIIHLGSFDTIEEAVKARRVAEVKYHGNFRRK